jgi:hypothetical protein
MWSSTSPALVDSRRVRLPLRWVVRSSVRSYRAAPIAWAASASMSSWRTERHRLAHDIERAAGAHRVEQLGQGRL